MPEVVTQDVLAEQSRSAVRPVMLGLAAMAGVLVAATLALWAHYGTAVFYEIIAAGIAFCF